jgi:hypothetical protein
MTNLITIVTIFALGFVNAEGSAYAPVDTTYKPQPVNTPPSTSYQITVNPGGPIKPVGPIVSPGGPIHLGPGPVIINPYPTVNPGGPIIRPTSTPDPIAYPIAVKPQPIIDPVPVKANGSPVYN